MKTKQIIEEWEKEFNKEFLGTDHLGDLKCKYPVAIKDFIRQQRQEAVEEFKRTTEGMKYLPRILFQTRDEQIEHAKKEAYAAGFDAGQGLVNEQKKQAVKEFAEEIFNIYLEPDGLDGDYEQVRICAVKEFKDKIAEKLKAPGSSQHESKLREFAEEVINQYKDTLRKLGSD